MRAALKPALTARDIAGKCIKKCRLGAEQAKEAIVSV